MSDYLDKIRTQKKDGTPIAIVPFQDSAARQDITKIQNELTTDTTTIEDNPLNFSLLSAQHAKSTILSLEPIQDLHGYDKPWVGGAGKNKYSVLVGADAWGANSGGSYTNDNGILVVTTSTNNNSGAYSESNSIISTLASELSGEYTYSFYAKANTNLTGRIGYANYGRVDVSLTTNWQRFLVTTTFNNTVPAFCVYGTGTAGTIYVKDVMIESGSVMHDYEPYSNICPISGRTEIRILGCRKNLFNPDVNSIEELDLNGSGTIRYGHSFGSGTYTLINTGTDTELFYYRTPKKDLSDRGSTIQLANNSSVNVTVDNDHLLWVFTSNSNFINADKIAVEIGSNQTFEAYNLNTDLTIHASQTVYGGTLDVENGVLVMKDGKKKINDLSWTYDSTNTRFTAIGIDYKGGTVRTVPILSSSYECVDDGRPFGQEPPYCIFGDATRIMIKDARYTDTTTFESEMGNEDICYELATPITIQLTPHEISLLEGVNNISILDDNASAKLTYRNGKMATLSDLLDLEKKVTDEEPYGFIEHMSILDPAQRIEYIGKNKNYSPMTINLAGDHLANYNEWYDFPVIKENKPYMIKADGTVDYALDPNDYTKKFDGSASDVANTSYTGGAFAWIPKTYKKEFVVGDDRYVYISTKKLSDEYEAIGFIDENGLEHDGAWIPMFYGTEITQDGTVKIMSLATGAPTQNRNTDTQKTYLTNANPDTLFFGGPIVNVLADLLIMLGKNSDIQAVFGTGNMSGGNGAQYMKDNACINGGAFYGTTTNNVLNKAFHSLVLLTQNQYQRDPYTLNIQGEYVVSPYYKYDLTGDSYVKTGVYVTPPSSNNWVYPNKSVSVPHWGAIPVGPYSGSSTTGWADGQYTLATQLTDTTVRVVLRFAYCSDGRAGGPRCMNLDAAASDTFWNIGASPLLLSKEKTPN